MKIAVFLPNWVGDAVMATPALRALRNHYREAEIVAVLRRPIDDVLAGTGLVDRVLIHAPKGRDPWQCGLRFALKLRAEAFDTAILFPNSVRTAWLAYVAGAVRRVGFARDRREWLLTDALQPKSREQPHPVIDEYLRIVNHLGIETSSRQTEIAVSAADEQRFNEFLAGLPSDLRSRSIIALNPGGAFGAAKHWPVQHFASLAKRLSNESGRLSLVLCGPSEIQQARDIVRLAGHPLVVSLADQKLSIGLTKAAVRAAELLVTTDSGPRHFAAPFGVPAITLFGPTHIGWSETFSSDAVHLQLPVDCGPCQQRVCPLGHHRCMVDLPVDRVFEAAEVVLRSRDRRAA